MSRRLDLSARRDDLALIPETCIVACPDGSEKRVIAPRRWLKDENPRLVSQARRFVVSRRPEAFVEKLARKRDREA